MYLTSHHHSHQHPPHPHTPRSRMYTGPWVFFHNQTFVLVTTHSVRPFDYSVSDITVAFAPVHTLSSRSSISHEHMSTGFFRNQTFALVTAHSVHTNAQNLSSINLVSIFRCSSSPRNPVYGKCINLSSLAFSLSSHRHSYISLLFISRFID